MLIATKIEKLHTFAYKKQKMSQESRLKKSLLNARVNLIFYFLSLALSFSPEKSFWMHWVQILWG